MFQVRFIEKKALMWAFKPCTMCLLFVEVYVKIGGMSIEEMSEVALRIIKCVSFACHREI